MALLVTSEEVLLAFIKVSFKDEMYEMLIRYWYAMYFFLLTKYLPNHRTNVLFKVFN